MAKFFTMFFWATAFNGGVAIAAFLIAAMFLGPHPDHGYTLPAGQVAAVLWPLAAIVVVFRHQISMSIRLLLAPKPPG